MKKNLSYIQSISISLIILIYYLYYLVLFVMYIVIAILPYVNDELLGTMA